jgi:type II secretory pathway pseudopilin PulG
MQLVVGQSTEKGDTLIEVMIAFALFAAIAVTTLAVMNQGTGTVQRALEITLVRAQMDSQIEALQYVHEAYVAGFQRGTSPSPGTTAAQWTTLKSAGYSKSAASPYGQLTAGQCPSPLPANAFIMNAQKATAQKANLTTQPPADGSSPPFSQVLYDPATGLISKAYGIWIEAVKSPVGAIGTPYIDFNIRACWNGSGSSVPATLGTIVRLYDPS